MGQVQQSFSINPEVGFPGTLARPSEPHATGSGRIYVPTNGRAPRPGDALYYDAAQNRFAIPTSDAEDRMVCAILGYRMDEVAQSDSTVQFSDGDEIQFFTHGTVWVTAGVALEYGQRMLWDRSSGNSQYRWIVAGAAITTAAANNAATTQALANDIRTYLNAPVRCPIVYVNRDPVSAGGIAMAQIGYGWVL